MKTTPINWLGEYIWLFFLCLIVNLFLHHIKPLTWAGIWAQLTWQLLVAAAIGALVGLGVLTLVRFLFLKK